ncbi:MAG: ribosome assembly cofactor RimP [Bacteroidetes bacterium]|nr:ribosome assembly cofactor RimP [Bacteroidota bacterium]MBU1371867.1 ribosome assembly cofactor RimP [Bacteroidota bacterium]MBU1483248.1 ribosome assembly cofactor RimP [Bacteroidota bacterium]MBU1761601.1 ribosome assembly cofactor RimP [Bacteroidota bacterium]MBU2046256.1 ribosome assembly cofactor RimP [Bacteroidota bacterium]
MNVEKRIRELIEEKIADRPDLFIVEIKVANNSKIMILLDGDEGVGIHDCAMVSRHVGFHLEEENLIDKAYHLEVGSPGLDTPLLLDRQYKKNVGRVLIIKLKDGKQLEGNLISQEGDTITINEMVKEKGKKAKEVERIINKNEISEVKVGVSFK